MDAGEFFKVVHDPSNPESGNPDVFVGSAEVNAIWTLLNPQYSVVIPDGADDAPRATRDGLLPEYLAEDQTG